MASHSFYSRLTTALCCVLLLSACASLPNSLALDVKETNGGESHVQQQQGAQAGVDPNVQTVVEPGVISERIRQERADAFNPYVLTAHKHNFILPVSYSTGINEAVYEQNDAPLGDGLQPAEVKFQISLKSQLNEKNLFFENDSLSVGITLEAWWQLYSSDLSSPFRETNYQPEIFYLVPLLWGPFGGNTAAMVGFEHQSNGLVPGLSRSWNRLYATLIYERGAFVAHVRPWYRLPEDAKEEVGDAEGDDNPDILDFMGHGEVGMSWRKYQKEYAVRIRGNPSTKKGAITIGMTFPLFAKFRGFVQYFNGYGDSLIDYDHHQQRLGLGVALTSLF
ncbi:MAG: phospholipase A1 [Granulosicoccus sp.]|jgi:phospholipase A1